MRAKEPQRGAMTNLDIISFSKDIHTDSQCLREKLLFVKKHVLVACCLCYGPIPQNAVLFILHIVSV